jgi:hypothetical protein
MKYEISFDRPSRELSPNIRQHWTKGYKAKKRARQAATLLAQSAWGGDAPRWRCAKVTITWVMPTKAHHPDADNAIASLKAWFDGFSDWGIVENDRGLWPAWNGIEVAKTAEWPRGRVHLVFEEIDK